MGNLVSMIFSPASQVSQVALDYEAKEKPKDKESGKTKKIIISFDGTGGEPEWGIQNEEKVKNGTVAFDAVGLSNISKGHLLVGGSLENSRRSIDDQIALYYSGVGTRGKVIAQFRKALNLGTMTDIYMMAVEDLEICYNEGDELYVFGFSRGAATARLFASFLDRKGLNIDGKQIKPKIKFLGVYDTVPDALNRGYINIGRRQLDVNYDSWFTMSQSESSLPKNVETVIHLIALDDLRFAFRPTQFNEDKRVTEVWCAGCHSDVGGGYYYDGLSDGSFTYMLHEANKAGLVYRTITQDTVKNDPHSLIGNDQKLKDVIDYDQDLIIEPDPTDPNVHNEDLMMYKVTNAVSGFVHRLVCKIKDDETVTDEPILVLDNVIDRIKDKQNKLKNLNLDNSQYTAKGYRPQNLKGRRYRIVNSQDGTISEVYDGIENNVDVQWD